ncbi:MAG: hypothetical protein WCI94_10455 [Rhodospirillales bacterium]
MRDNDRVPGVGALEMAAYHLTPDGRPDSKVVRALRARLDEICRTHGPTQNFTRADVIEIFDALAETVGAVMDTESVHDDITIIHQHTTTQLVRQVVTAIQELDKGVVDEWLRPTGSVGSSKYKPRELDSIRTALETVWFFRTANRIKLAEAEKLAAEFCRKWRIKVRGKEITARKLQGWRRMPPDDLKQIQVSPMEFES